MCSWSVQVANTLVSICASMASGSSLRSFLPHSYVDSILVTTQSSASECTLLEGIKLGRQMLIKLIDEKTSISSFPSSGTYTNLRSSAATISSMGFWETGGAQEWTAEGNLPCGSPKFVPQLLGLGAMHLRQWHSSRFESGRSENC